MATTAALPIEECLKGFEVALDNAARLHRTAQGIVSSDPHSAALLAVYAADEMGKASLIAHAALRRDKGEATWEEFRDEFTQHPTKLRMINKLTVLLEGGFMLPDEYVEKIVRHFADATFKRRNAVAYVDMVNDQFVPPTVAVTRPECEQTVQRVGEVLEQVIRVRPRVIDMFREDMRRSTGS